VSVERKDERAQGAPTAGSEVQVASLPANRSAPGEARRFIRSWLGDHTRATDAALAVSEVVTNAVRHGAADDTGLRLRLRETGGGFRVELDQPSAGTVEAPAGFPGPDRPMGRGLAVVEALSDRWGVTYGSGPMNTMTVWFEM
jgi:anti-sigma regulatory factor (Ser/Thr protein kinase)